MTILAVLSQTDVSLALTSVWAPHSTGKCFNKVTFLRVDILLKTGHFYYNLKLFTSILNLLMSDTKLFSYVKLPPESEYGNGYGNPTLGGPPTGPYFLPS